MYTKINLNQPLAKEVPAGSFSLIPTRLRLNSSIHFDSRISQVSAQVITGKDWCYDFELGISATVPSIHGSTNKYIIAWVRELLAQLYLLFKPSF